MSTLTPDVVARRRPDDGALPDWRALPGEPLALVAALLGLALIPAAIAVATYLAETW
ncbi:MAG: hypothetical protein IRZ09_15260 [Variibacter sp.]|nr:hypothetical protein [Variibacter sp.]